MNFLNLESTNEFSSSIKFIEEIAIIIAAKNLTPTMISQDFLKSSGIIPQNWELSQQPVLNPNFAQLNFKNGINILAQPRAINITESITGKNLSELQAPAIASKFVEKLPLAEYQGLSFSPRIIVPFPNHQEAAYKYITKNLLVQGSWQEIGKGLVQAGINLVYQLERCQLNLSISEARLQQAQQAPVFALLFSGGFNYNLAQENQQQSLGKLQAALNYWQTDLKTFREIVNQKFLEETNIDQFLQTDTIFPVGAM